MGSKLQHYGPCKISWKNSKTSHLDNNGHITKRKPHLKWCYNVLVYTFYVYMDAW
jgi:hypothetical protein